MKVINSYAKYYYQIAISLAECEERMERIFEIIEEQLHLTGVEITEDSSFKDDLGADSIDLVELIMAFEDEYGIEASYEEIEKNVKTVGDVIEYLRNQGADI